MGFMVELVQFNNPLAKSLEIVEFNVEMLTKTDDDDDESTALFNMVMEMIAKDEEDNLLKITPEIITNENL
jgi:hypothetical protein